MNDQTTIKKILAGHTDAYADLVRQNHIKVISLCLSFLRNRTQAEDAAQDIFIKAYQSLNTYRGDASFSTWLYRITIRHCQDLLRQHTRKKTHSLDELLEQHGDKITHLLSAPRTTHISAEDKELLHQVTQTLTPEHQTILTLREAQGLTYNEIAQTMNCTLDSVKSRLKRARQEIQEKARHFLAPQNV